MAIISFAKTIDPYRRRIKTVTRRDWKDSYLENWQRWFDEGRHMHDAWTQLPRVSGAHCMGELRLTARPYKERLADMPKADLRHEGGMVETRAEFYDLIGLPPEKEVSVVRFEPLPTEPLPQAEGAPRTVWFGETTVAVRLNGLQMTPTGLCFALGHVPRAERPSGHAASWGRKIDLHGAEYGIVLFLPIPGEEVAA